MSLVEWPWLIQPRLNWLTKILSDPISIWCKIKDLHVSVSPGSGYCHPFCELQYTLRKFRLIYHESLMKAISVSLREKMKRFNIVLFIPSYKCSSVFDLPHAHICRNHCEIQQKPDWIIIFIKCMPPRRILQWSKNEIRLLGKMKSYIWLMTLNENQMQPHMDQIL